MTVRTAYVGTQVAGDVLTAANFTKLPGGWLGYAEVTANQASITTIVDLTGLSVTVTAGTSRKVRVTGHVNIQANSATSRIDLVIADGSNTILQLKSSGTGTVSVNNELTVQFVHNPTAGSNTYKLRCQDGAGAGSITLSASATSPAFILVEDIGPAA